MTPPQTGLFLSAWCRCRVGQTQEYFRCADSHLDSLMTTKNVFLENVYLNYQNYVLKSWKFSGHIALLPESLR